MILELHPSIARTAEPQSAASQTPTSPTPAELEAELRELRRRLDELSEEVRSARAPAVRRRTPRRRRGAHAQERRELRAQHEERALDQLSRAGLNRLF